MINYIEKGEGLHIAIAQAGHFLGQNDQGEWISSDDEAVQAIIDSYQEETPVPVYITPRQARLVLLQMGLLDQVNTMIDSLPEPNRTAAKIEWEYAVDIARYSMLVITMTTALGLSESQVDDLFRTASVL